MYMYNTGVYYICMFIYSRIFDLGLGIAVDMSIYTSSS